LVRPSLRLELESLGTLWVWVQLIQLLSLVEPLRLPSGLWVDLPSFLVWRLQLASSSQIQIGLLSWALPILLHDWRSLVAVSPLWLLF
jgi:hypothetical protein